MAAKQTRDLAVVSSYEALPAFASEAEEARFWTTHRLSPALLREFRPVAEDDAPLPPPRLRSRSISLRVPESLLTAVKALAARRGQLYQTLLKQLVQTGLTVESRPRRPSRRSATLLRNTGAVNRSGLPHGSVSHPAVKRRSALGMPSTTQRVEPKQLRATARAIQHPHRTAR